MHLSLSSPKYTNPFWLSVTSLYMTQESMHQSRACQSKCRAEYNGAHWRTWKQQSLVGLWGYRARQAKLNGMSSYERIFVCVASVAIKYRRTPRMLDLRTPPFRLCRYSNLSAVSKCGTVRTVLNLIWKIDKNCVDSQPWKTDLRKLIWIRSSCSMNAALDLQCKSSQGDCQCYKDRGFQMYNFLGSKVISTNDNAT